MKNKSKSLKGSAARAISYHDSARLVAACATSLGSSAGLYVQLEIPDLLPIASVDACGNCNKPSKPHRNPSKKRRASAVIDPRQLKLVFVEDCTPSYEA
jgi:hypothetical protein